MKIKFWIKAFRLRTLPLSVSCILMGCALASIDYRVDLRVVLFSLITTILLQILSNLANDYGDGVRGTDKARKGEQRMVQSGFISKKQMLFAVVIFGILSFLSGVVLLYFSFGLNQLSNSVIFLFLGLLAIWGAIKYTMGKIPYGYIGLGDVFVFIFFGIVGVCGSYFLLTKDLDLTVIPGVLICGCLSVGVLNMNNIRDYDSDKIAGKRTVVVKRGLKWAKVYHVLLLAIAMLSYLSLYVYTNNTNNHILLIGLLPMLILLTNAKKVILSTENSQLDSELKKIALSTFLIALILVITFGYF
ncbi:MAG: 1,4-dihydroxy-2-naphthoate octaprenyltransferase [Crocinitomicaceae bacterium]|nr:1,4-dihydroxy-2-naphthoate octaprenyltransferase [Crocinitomicaceae bacterium]